MTQVSGYTRNGHPVRGYTRRDPDSGGESHREAAREFARRRGERTPGLLDCGDCGGSGKKRLVPWSDCGRCGGTGDDPYAHL